MRNRATHFEQVSMQVVETVLRRAAVLAAILEKSPPPVSALEPQAVTEILKLEETARPNASCQEDD